MASTVLTAQIIAEDQTDVASKLSELLDATAGGLAHANLLDIEIVHFGQNQFVILVAYHV